MLEVRPDLVTVLADTIERSEDLDKERAEASKKQAETLAQKGVSAQRTEPESLSN